MKLFRFFPVVLLLLLFGAGFPARAEEDAAENPYAARLEQLKKNAAARRATLRRTSAVQVTPRAPRTGEGGALDTAKLNALLANAAVRERGRRARAVSPLAAGDGVSARNGVARSLTAANGTLSRSPYARTTAAPGMSPAGATVRPPRNNGVDAAVVQKAVEAALAKRDAESLGGRLKSLVKKILPAAEKSAAVAATVAR